MAQRALLLDDVSQRCLPVSDIQLIRVNKEAERRHNLTDDVILRCADILKLPIIMSRPCLHARSSVLGTDCVAY